LKRKKRNRYFALFCLFLFSLIIIQYYRGNSERPADTTSPAIYENAHVRFSYPGNWNVTEDVGEGTIHYIMIDSPGYAFFIIQIYAQEDAIPLQQFAEQFSEVVKQEDASSTRSNSSFSDFEEGKLYGIQENFLSKALGSELPHIRRYYSVTGNNKTAYLISQVAREDLTKVDAGFSLILKSLFLKKGVSTSLA
jgi:hypothetical protein